MYQLMLAHIRMLTFIQMYRKRTSYILLTMLIFFFNIDFQRSKSVFTLDEIIYTSQMFHPEYIPRTSVARSGFKIVYNFSNDEYVMTRGRKNVTSESTPSTHNSFIQQCGIILIWYSGTRWPMYQMRSTDINIIIIIQMYSKRQNYILRIMLSFFKYWLSAL